MQHSVLAAYQHDLQRELGHILHWWEEHGVDKAAGGFCGRVDNNNKPDPTAPRGVVLNSRIIWTFAAAARTQQNDRWLGLATRAYDYFRTYFIDREQGGVFWSVKPDGSPMNTRKQVYGQAFAIYGLSEYYRAGGPKEALEEAIAIFQWVEKYSFDAIRTGYLEAFARDGAALTDLRLSPKDRNDPKTMNTHLHVLEAYANLYRLWQDAALAHQLRQLIQIFLDQIVDPLSGHLHLFFDVGWAPQADILSYGHDIEAAWLLLEASEVLGDSALQAKCRENAVIMATAAARGLDETKGGLRYENHSAEKHWWVQAEAMLGFFNAWQISKEEHFIQKSLNCWNFVQQHLLDRKHGEWYWGLDAKHKLMLGKDKAGFWKGPYHNSRACMGIIERLKQE